MKHPGCENEVRILEALGQGLTPEALEEPLRRHIAGCDSCRELTTVSEMFRQDSAELCAAAPVPEAGRVWWRATLAARRAATERALRPIRIAEKTALAIGGGVLAALLIFFAPWLAGQLRHSSAFSGNTVSTFSLSTLIITSVVFCLALMAGALLTLWAEK